MTENHDRKDSREVSREELYRQVWQTPMSRLALQYGISGNGLAKICDRLKVPYPKRGYWARKAAGQKVIAFRLPPGDEDIAVSIMALGIAIALAWRPPEWIALLLIAIFAICHGYAHGSELPKAEDPADFAIGFVIATGLIHLFGIGGKFDGRGKIRP